MFSWFKTNRQLRDRIFILERQLAEAQVIRDLRKALYRASRHVSLEDQGVGSSVRPEPSYEVAQFLSGISVKEDK